MTSVRIERPRRLSQPREVRASVSVRVTAEQDSGDLPETVRSDEINGACVTSGYGHHGLRESSDQRFPRVVSRRSSQRLLLSSVPERLPQFQTSGLQERYASDEAFGLAVRLLPALAFVPPQHVVHAFERVQENLPAEAESISDYFEDTYT